jgi:hypothetical protein
MGHPPITASELAEFEYCRRAWGYARRGVATAHGRALADGRRWHVKQGRFVRHYQWLRLSGWLFLVTALLLGLLSLPGGH